MSDDTKNNIDQNTEQGTDIAVIAEKKVMTEQPPLYRVLLHNDDFTPMDFVINILEKFFNKNHAEATEIMLSVHNKGLGVCGVYPFEIAETKVAFVTEHARENEYPLQCTMEKA
jgi:ATP-dependent Clp protease adaptor protein ClpS